MRSSISTGSIVLGVAIALIATLLLIGAVMLVGSQQEPTGALGAKTRAVRLAPRGDDGASQHIGQRSSIAMPAAK